MAFTFLFHGKATKVTNLEDLLRQETDKLIDALQRGVPEHALVNHERKIARIRAQIDR